MNKDKKHAVITDHPLYVAYTSSHDGPEGTEPTFRRTRAECHTKIRALLAEHGYTSVKVLDSRKGKK